MQIDKDYTTTLSSKIISINNCHSLNSSSTQVEGDKVDHPPTTPHYTTPPTTTFKALPDNLGSWLSVCNLILTQLERQPQKRKGRQPKKMEDDLKKYKNMEDDLNCFLKNKNGDL
jgi:hypothetical protein